MQLVANRTWSALVGAIRFLDSRVGSGERNANSTQRTLHDVLSNTRTGQALRGHYSRCRGGENMEFLLACSNFDNTKNPLQRFEQLRHIIHRFVHPTASRPIALRSEQRARMLEEWMRWAEGNRVPANAQLPALCEAAEEIARVIDLSSSRARHALPDRAA